MNGVSQEAAAKIIKIMLTADERCFGMTRDLLVKFLEDFPEHGVIVEALFRDEDDFEV